MSRHSAPVGRLSTASALGRAEGGLLQRHLRREWLSTRNSLRLAPYFNWTVIHRESDKINIVIVAGGASLDGN